MRGVRSVCWSPCAISAAFLTQNHVVPCPHHEEEGLEDLDPPPGNVGEELLLLSYVTLDLLQGLEHGQATVHLAPDDCVVEHPAHPFPGSRGESPQEGVVQAVVL